MCKTRKQLEIEKTDELIERRRKFIEEQEEEIRKLEKLKRALEEKGDRWIPKIGDTYYYVSGTGYVYETQNNEGVYDLNLIRIGNCFKTEKEAEFEVERLKVITGLKEFAFEPDWEDNNQDKYVLAYNHMRKEIDYDVAHWVVQSNNIYFETGADVENAIKQVGEDRILKFLFGVEK